MNCFYKPEGIAEKTAALVLCLLSLLTVIFIFSNSMLSPDKSAETSGRLADIIAAIFPPETPIGAFLVNNLRKIAHFVEFAFLGTTVSALVALFAKNKKTMIPISAVFGFFVAFFDETLQIFSGRGPMIADVWLDVSGFVTLGAITHLAFFCYKKLKERRLCNGQNNRS